VISLDEEPSDFIEAGPPGICIDDILDRVDATQLVQTMLASLQDEERDALMLRYVEELSISEIATLMDRSERAVEHLLLKAKKKAARTASLQVVDGIRQVTGESADGAVR
jgi:RNA polymerase sigma factor (sigma-70 family)